MKLKRPLTLMLASLVLTACGGGAPTETTAPDAETTTAPADDAYSLPTSDYKGYKFNMLVSSDYESNYENSEITGDLVNDAIYSANRSVEELYNIELGFQSMPSDWNSRNAFMNQVRNSILADDDAYDAVFPEYYFGESLALEGNFIDISSIDAIDLSKPWWVDGFNDQAELFGKLYGVVGDYSLTDVSNQMAMFFNKRIYEDYGYENIYDLVRAGKWTYDKFLKMITDVGADIDNNEVYDEKDSYGFVTCSVGMRTFSINFGLKYLDRQSDGTPYICYKNEKMFEVYDMIYAMRNGMTETYDVNEQPDILPIFMDGRSFFLCASIGASPIMREMDDDFGIVPMPKYDEEQENYITYSMGVSLCCIPRTANDVERTGTVLNALNYYTHKDVLPAYYEIALKSKYSRDNDTAEMLDLIRENSFYDIGYIYSNEISAIAGFFGNSVRAKTENFASAYAAQEEAREALLATMLEKYRALT